jgi:4-amino-4-deoxy-L-arabinose transferase-like glycosyltransferase
LSIAKVSRVAIAGVRRLFAGRRLTPGSVVEARGAALEAAGLLVLLVAQAVLFARGLDVPPDFDEGAYLAETDAWRHGQELGSEVFTAQPPGFYVALRAGQFVFGDSVDGGRLTIVAFALLGTIAAWALARARVGPAGGLGAAALLGIAPVYATYASKVSADLPALALALAGLAVLAHGGGRRTAVVAGALLGVAITVKLSALTALVPLIALGWTQSRRLAWAASGAAAVGLAFLLAFVDDLGGLWSGVVSYHAAARDAPGPGYADNVERIVRLLDLRTPFGWLVPLGALATLVPRPTLRPLGAVWLWALAGAVFLAVHRPLHDNHMVLLATALAVPAGAALGARAATLRPRVAVPLAAALALFLAAGFGQEARRLQRNSGALPTGVLQAVALLEQRTQAGALVVSDLPIVPYLADRQMPGNVVDTAVLRFDAGYLDDEDVLVAAERADAVVAARAFRARPGLIAELARRFPERRQFEGVTVFLR